MRLVSLGLYLGLISAAWAQQPQQPVAPARVTPEITEPEDTINLVVGQAQKLNFPQPFDRIDLTSATIVEAKAITDHVMTLQALAAGETLMTVFAGAKELYSATIVVAIEPGHLVKIYGGGKNDDVNAGFVAVFCDELGCGRPDKDLPRATLSVSRVSGGPKDNPPPQPVGPLGPTGIR